ncbi:MAG: hypothetical protein ACPG8A_03955 [Psychrobium sp.]
MEELGESFFRVLIRILRTVLIEWMYEFTCYWAGRWFLQCVTLGRYPNKHQQQEHEGRISLVGLVVLLAIFIATINI